MHEKFIEAIKNGDDEQLAKLLEMTGADKPLVTTIADTHSTNHCIGFGMTLLQFASFRPWKGGHPSAVLMEQGANVDLHSACGLGQVEKITELVTTDPKEIENQIDTYLPIQFAISAARAESIRCLVKHGDDVNRDLRKVAYFGWEDEAIDQTYTPWKPIHMASLWGFDATRVPVAQALAEAGADLNAISPLDGFRPIHLVAMPNRVEMIEFFVAQGVNVDSRTEACNSIALENEDATVEGHSCTPLMVAAAEGFAEATACLLKLGADPNAKNDLGLTAMDFARKRYWNGQPYDQVIEILTGA